MIPFFFVSLHHFFGFRFRKYFQLILNDNIQLLQMHASHCVVYENNVAQHYAMCCSHEPLAVALVLVCFFFQSL